MSKSWADKDDIVFPIAFLNMIPLRRMDWWKNFDRKPSAKSSWIHLIKDMSSYDGSSKTLECVEFFVHGFFLVVLPPLSSHLWYSRSLFHASLNRVHCVFMSHLLLPSLGSTQLTGQPDPRLAKRNQTESVRRASHQLKLDSKKESQTYNPFVDPYIQR